MRATQALRQSVHGLMAIILLLTLTACFGGGGGGSSGADGETIISLPSGGQVVIPEGALPSGADVSAESVPTPVLPDDVTAVGEAFSITATADLIKPATLRLPIPAGVTDPSNLVVVRVESDGTTTFLMSEVEGGELVTSTPGFSTFQSALLDSLSEQVIISGEISLLPGERAGYSALHGGYSTGLLHPVPERLLRETKWTIESNLLSIVSESANTVVVQATEDVPTPDAPGGVAEVILCYEAYALDSVRRWWGCKRITLASNFPVYVDATLNLYTITPRVYAQSQPVQISARVTGPEASTTPPITWEWSFGDGHTGSETTGPTTTSFQLPDHIYDCDKDLCFFTVQVDATWNVTGGSRHRLFITVEREPLAVALDGPKSLPWAEPSVSGNYTATATGYEGLFTYRWTLAPGMTTPIEDYALIDKSVQQFTFDQPGEHHVKVEVEDAANKKTSATLAVMVGPPDPLDSFILDLPSEWEIDKPISVNVRARDGVLVVSGKKAGYEIDFDWREGAVQKFTDVGLANRPSDATFFPIPSHTYTTTGRKTVVATVYDATRAKAEDVREILITEPAGGFGFPSKAVCPQSVTVLSCPVGWCETDVYKAFDLVDIYDFGPVIDLYEAKCEYQLASPGTDDIHKAASLYLYYAPGYPNNYHCGETTGGGETYVIDSGAGLNTAYSTIRQLRADDIGGGTFKNPALVLGELVTNANNAAVGSSCP